MVKRMNVSGLIVVVILTFLFFSPVSANAGASLPHVPSQVIVCFGPEVSGNDAELDAIASSLHAHFNATVIENSSTLGIPGAQLVQLPDTVTVADAVAWYLGNASVLFAEPNYIISLVPPPEPGESEKFSEYAELAVNQASLSRSAAIYPNDPYFPEQWNLHTIQMPAAWGITTGSESVVIAVLDTGVNYNLPEFAGNIWINRREIPNNRIDDDGNGFVDDVYGWDFFNNDNTPLDDNGHGTKISSVLGSKGNNNAGLAGILWNVKIMPLRVGGNKGNGVTLEVDKIVKGIKYARENGAKVITCSFGNDDYINSEKAAIDQSPGILFVCAAGNDGKNTDAYPFYPSCYESPNIISVAATNNNDKLSDFSNYGKKSVHVGAPGEDIPVQSYDSQYYLVDGTSYAVPHVAGLAGLMLSINPDLSPSEMRQLIIENVDQAPFSGLVRSGGRINAYKTLQATISSKKYSITANSTKGGTISPSGTLQVPSGTSVIFTITADPGYKVSRVIIDGIDYGPLSIFTFSNVGADHSIVAFFEEKQNTGRNLTIPLEREWNFISVPAPLQPGYTTAGKVFDGVDTDGRLIFSYDSRTGQWQVLHTDSAIEPWKGLWVYSSQRTTISLNLQKSSQGYTLVLYPGWNAVGCPGTSPIAVRDAFSPIANSWTQAIGYNAAQQQYQPSLIRGGSGSHSDSSLLQPGQGYWVYVTDQCSLR